jgi:hypothetical protein
MDPNPTGQTTPEATPPPPPWGVAAPTSSGGGMGGAVGGAIKRRVLGALGGLIVLAVIGGGIFIYTKVANPDHLGQVIYSTDDPAGVTGCSITHEVTSVKVGTAFYSTYVWQHQLKVDQTVVEEDFRDGVSLGTYNIPTDKSSEADCLTISTDLSSEFTSPGSYEVKLTTGGEVVADGKLTVTP